MTHTYTHTRTLTLPERALNAMLEREPVRLGPNVRDYATDRRIGGVDGVIIAICRGDGRVEGTIEAVLVEVRWEGQNHDATVLLEQGAVEFL